ncbi:hypothetical protein D3C74_403960 [compost metagenome]
MGCSREPLGFPRGHLALLMQRDGRFGRGGEASGHPKRQHPAERSGQSQDTAGERVEQRAQSVGEPGG